MSAGTSAWQEANQRYLTAALAELRQTLEQRLAPVKDGAAGVAPGDLAAAREALPAPAALDRIAALFSLSQFERELLLLCAGPELDSAFGSCLAALHADPARRYPTFGLALAVLTGAHWSALLPSAPLRRFRLIDVAAGDALTASALRIDERALHYLTGTPCLDERLRGLVEPVDPPALVPASHRAATEQLAGLWQTGGCLVSLSGEPMACRAVAAEGARRLGLELFAIQAADVPGAAAARETFSRLWEREAVLIGAALLLELDDGDAPDAARGAVALAESLGTPVVLGSREPVPARRRPVARVELGSPNAAERAALWRAALGEAARELDGALPPIVAQFALGSPGISAAGAAALQTVAREPSASLAECLWGACRTQARPRLDELAQRIDATARWEDLVLPGPEIATLLEICTHVRQRVKVYDDWGFEAQSSRGLGISALFAGSSGTGKTMAAEVIARELRLDLYRIDLSGVVDKYVGETEKKLRRIFDAAESGGCILLFDEADALFGKRTEVKDSHDRFANIEVSYLLQRMEAYRGLAILTTNLKDAIDRAFLRRLRFVVDFPFPNAAQRAEIWRRVFPQRAPTEGLDASRLAQLNLAGGNIRNIALGSAFLAAEADEPVRMEHVLRAARTEYRKLELPLTGIETRGW